MDPQRYAVATIGEAKKAAERGDIRTALHMVRSAERRLKEWHAVRDWTDTAADDATALSEDAA